MPSQLRSYQLRVIEEVGQRNVIVKMPTGSGKTLVAAECIKLASQRVPAADRALFLVPTCDLVEQQARAVRDWCTGFRVEEFRGSLKAPRPGAFDVLVATPEAFRQLQMREAQHFGWENFYICVFDEVHHVLKDHPYRKLAHSLHTLRTHKSSTPQILGLSASLTYAVSEATVKKALQSLSEDLGLHGMVSVTDAELRAGGYEPPHGEVERVSPYSPPEGVVPAELRKPHLMHKIFFDRIGRREATDFATDLHAVVTGLEAVAVGFDATFVSPISKPSLSSWEELAHRLATSKGVPAAVANGGTAGAYGGAVPDSAASFFRYLEDWYVALRLLVTTWEEEEELVLQWLQCRSAFEVQVFLPSSATSATAEAMRRLLCRLEAADGSGLSKVACLRAQLLEKAKWVRARGDELRCLVFVQQRIAAHVLSRWIGADPSLQAAGLRADYVAARNATITPRLKVTAGQASDCVRRFRTGELNVIVATAVLEEGFDVPESNVVISYDALKDSVELAQRFGRARQAERRIVALCERRDRPLDRLEEVRREQDVIIEAFEPAATKSAAQLAAEQAAARSRERGAASLLRESEAVANAPNPVATLNLYVKKTKAVVEDSFYKTGSEFVYITTYQTSLRDLRGEGRATSKKAAKTACAKQLLLALRAAGGAAQP